MTAFFLAYWFCFVSTTAGEKPVDIHIVNRRVEHQQTFSEALLQAGLAHQETQLLVTALDGVFDFHRVHRGDSFRITRHDGQLFAFDYWQGPADAWQVRFVNGQALGKKRSFPVEKRVETITLFIENSLYDAVVSAKESQGFAMSLADVFAWDIDFYRDPQKGDVASALIEKFVLKGRTLRYGDILAAQYQGSTLGNKQVFRYQFPNGEISYFLPDGSSARKTFLKSPLKYANITSKFGSRFHPVLKFVRSHNGVDYGTPIGTPVWAVADGFVTKAEFHRGGGNTLCIRHHNGMSTCYLHLSRFAQGVRKGTRVQQKQIVAYSGNTGMSTGPHLHFELHRGEQPVNPLKQDFPRADPIPASLRKHFLETAAQLASQLRAQGNTTAAMP